MLLEGLWHIFLILQILQVDFVGCDGYAGVGLDSRLAMIIPKSRPWIIKDGPAAVAMVEIKVQFKEIIGCS